MENQPTNAPENLPNFSLPDSKEEEPEYSGNLEKRIKLLDEAERDPALQADLFEICKNDILFFFDYFLWTYNPKVFPNHFPFIPYARQRELILEYQKEIREGFGSLTEKSRETGVTYLHLGVRIHFWLFIDAYEGLVLSLRQEDVDNATPSSIFGKFRYMVDRLPYWLRPLKWNRTKHAKFMALINPDNGNTIVGQATTPDAGRSGRKTDVLVDEHASIPARLIQGIEVSLQETANCIHRVSTPKGINLFKAVRDRGVCKVHTFHWTKIPGKAKGLYYYNEAGERIDASGLPEDRINNYGFLIGEDGKTTKYKLRSPWYDRKCREYISPRDIAQELDINYLGSGHCRFDVNFIEQGSARTRDGKRGYLKNAGTEREPKPEFVEVAPGAPFELEVWEFPILPVFVRRHFIGSDVAEGLEKGDYSSADVIRKDYTGMTGKHVAHLHGHFTPDVWAEKLVLLALWYDLEGTEAAVERNKDGLGVILAMRNTFKFRNIFKGGDGRDGFLTTAANKFTLTGNLDEALRNGELTTESLNHFTEFSTFENNNGKLGATGTNHDDRVMSLAIGWEAARQAGKPSEREGGRIAKIQKELFNTRGY